VYGLRKRIIAGSNEDIYRTTVIGRKKLLAMREKDSIYMHRQRGVTWGTTSAETVEFNGLRRCKNVKLLWSFGGTGSLPVEAMVWRRYEDVGENNDRRLMGGDELYC